MWLEEGREGGVDSLNQSCWSGLRLELICGCNTFDSGGDWREGGCRMAVLRGEEEMLMNCCLVINVVEAILVQSSRDRCRNGRDWREDGGRGGYD